MDTRMKWVDAARGIAILGVVAVHVGQRVANLSPWVLSLTGAGRYGVQVFFIASGLTIFASVRRRQSRREPALWPAFFIRRFARIAPVAYAGMLANILVNAPEITVGGVALTVLFVDGWSYRWSNVLIQGGWILSVVALFYVMVPVLVRVVRSAGAAAVLVVSATAAGVVLRFVGQMLHPAWGASFFYTWPPAQMAVVASGVLLYFLTAPDEPPAPAWVRWGATGAGIVGAALVVTGNVPGAGGAQYVYSAVFVCGMLALAARPARVVVNRVTVWLGTVSYSVFIWHFFALDAVLAMFGRTPSGEADLAAVYAGTLALSMVAGWLSYVTLERVAENVGRRVAARLAPAAG